MRRSLAGAAADDFRPDVEGLRAVAVIAVVAFHLRLGWASGGFVGVDVFFVLSGFLITRLLLKELAATGSLALRAFWARRARRLLPAATLVIVATVLAGYWALPPLAMRSLAIDAVAAACFVANFVFAHRLGDYFGAQLGATAPSPLLHVWSLSVEEQFYLLWPLLLVALTRWTRQYRRMLLVVILAGAGLSLVASVWLTEHQPTWAFYLLPARAGELLAGAALAVAGSAFGDVPARWRAAAGWLGIAGIVVAVARYSDATAFPGTAVALPVLATVLVVVAGGTDHDRWSPATMLGHPALQWVGRHSYAIYLWHWPALVLAEARYGPLDLPARLLVVAIAVGLSAVSYRFVEDPIRHNRWLAWRPGRGLTLGASLCSVSLVVGLIALVDQPRLDGGTIASAPVLVAPSPTTVAGPVPATAVPATSDPPTTTAAAVATTLPAGDLASLTASVQQVLAAGLATTDVPANLRPALAHAGGDRAQVYADDCVAIGVETALKPCRYGNPSSDVVIVLYGDSHAAQWFPPLKEIADTRGLRLVVLTKGGCPNAVVPIPTATLNRTCPIWRDAAVSFLTDLHPDLVITTSWARYPNSDEEWTAGFRTIVDRLLPTTDHLLVLGDNPGSKTQPAACLSGHLHGVDACTTTPAKAVAASRLTAEQAVAAAAGATYVDTSQWLCTPTGCPVIIGDILLYRDATHLTTIATAWLRPLLEAAIAPLLGLPV